MQKQISTAKNCKNNKYLMVWVNIIKFRGIATFKSIYPKILTSSRVRGICLFNKSDFSVINKSDMASCLELSKSACL